MALTFTSVLGMSQENDSFIPRWVSKKGFWVVESNAASPKTHVIRFYNNDNTLVYKETLSDVKLNLNKARIKMKLKRVLESSVVAFEKKKEQSEELALVRAAL